MRVPLSKKTEEEREYLKDIIDSIFANVHGDVAAALFPVSGDFIDENFLDMVESFEATDETFKDFKFDVNTVEWAGHKDEKSFKDAAVMYVKDLIDEMGLETFAEDFLMSNLDIEKTERLFTQIYDEWNNSYEEDIINEAGDEYDSRFIDELVYAGIIDSETAETLTANEAFNKYAGRLAEHMTKSQIEEGRGGYDYFASSVGKEEAMKIVDDYNLIDVDKVAEKAVEIDGPEHSLAAYDGNFYETNNGMILYRI